MQPFEPVCTHPAGCAPGVPGEEFERCAATDRNADSVARLHGFVSDHLLLRRADREENEGGGVVANEGHALRPRSGVVLQAIGRIEPANISESMTMAHFLDDSRRAADDHDRIVAADVIAEQVLHEWVQGERRDYFEAEGNFWRMISRVFEERERREILDAIDVMEEALEHLRVRLETCEGEERVRAEVQRFLEPHRMSDRSMYAVELVLESGVVSLEHVRNVIGRLNAEPAPERVETTLTLKEAPKADKPVLMFSFTYVIVNLLVDLLYLWIDPRMGRGEN